MKGQTTTAPELDAEATALTCELLEMVMSRTAHSAVAMDALASACMNVAHASKKLQLIPRVAQQMMNHPMVREACDATSDAAAAEGALGKPSTGQGDKSDLVAEVGRLAPRLQELARSARFPEVALNALLTAYLNTANQQGLLPHVPAAAAALGTAAQELLNRALSPSTPIASTHLH